MSKKTDLIIWFLIVVAIVYVYNHKGCGSGNTTRQSTDTLYVKGINDTTIIYKDTTIYKYLPSPVAVISPSGEYKYNDTIRAYNEEYRDSNTTVVVTDTVSGHLLSQSVQIKSSSINITRVDTVKIHTTDSIFIGKSKGILSPFIFTQTSNEALGVGLFYSKNKMSYITGYDFNNKNVLIGVGVRF